jgi:hypothetical protein
MEKVGQQTALFFPDFFIPLLCYISKKLIPIEKLGLTFV